MKTEKAEKRPATLGECWREEISAAKKWLAPWHRSTREILKRYKDVREKDDETRRLNLFTAEVLTKRAVLYGKVPTVSTSRRWNDAGDDVARVAGEMLGRLLNDGLQDGTDGYRRALGYCLDDRFLGGMGQARVRYEVEMEEQSPGEDMPGMPETEEPGEEVDEGEAPGSPPPTQLPAERKGCENVAVDYVFWGDFLWSPCRYWEVVRWVAFKAEMSRKALIERFDQTKFPTVRIPGAEVPLDASSEEDKEREMDPPWARATVWEVWDKEEEQVLWVTESGAVLDVRPDPLGLKSFFPCPRPLFALTTTDELIPRPDFSVAEDLYKDIDDLATRMHLLRSALRVVGVYDGTNTDLADLLEDASENRMVPVRNWALFGDKGGLSGAVDFFPIQQVASTLVALSGEFESLKARLYEVTGFSDILRGQGASTAVTATEQRIKANYGSARLQATQEEFAEFASALQQLKAEVICKHFEPEEIIRQSNMAFSADATPAPGLLQLLQQLRSLLSGVPEAQALLSQAMALAGQPSPAPGPELVQAAAQFLKDEHELFRVKVEPETLALSNFAAVKEERIEVVLAVSQFIQAVTPMVQFMPGAAPALLEILKWLVASLRGSSEIEGVLDKAMVMAQQASTQASQPGQQPQPDSKLLAEQMKAQAAQAQVDKELQADLVRIAAETQADASREATQRLENVREAAQKAQLGAAMRANGGLL